MGGTSASRKLSKQSDPCRNLWKNLSRLDSALPSLFNISRFVFFLYTGICILHNHIHTSKVCVCVRVLLLLYTYYTVVPHTVPVIHTLYSQNVLCAKKEPSPCLKNHRWAIQLLLAPDSSKSLRFSSISGVSIDSIIPPSLPPSLPTPQFRLNLYCSLRQSSGNLSHLGVEFFQP
jgi:hypothetical protein